MPDVIRLSIASENDTWDALRFVLDRDENFDNIEIAFEAASWIKFHLTLRGEKFHQSLTSDVMKGIVEYQNAMYRSIALLIHKSHKITTLTDKEREKFELVFNIRDGSSKVDAEGDKSVFDLLSEAMRKMGRREAFIIVLVLVLGYYGKDIALKYIDAGTEISKTQTEREHNKQISEQNQGILDLAKSVVELDKSRDVTLQRALEQSSNASRILGDSNRAFQSIVKGSSESEGINFQGLEIPAPIIQEYNRTSRRTARDVVLDGNFRIMSVISSGGKTFRVVLREADSLISFSAIIRDEKGTERFKKALQKAEWGKSWVKLKIKARRLGDQYIDAEIIKASTPRKRST